MRVYPRRSLIHYVKELIDLPAGFEPTSPRYKGGALPNELRENTVSLVSQVVGVALTPRWPS